MKESLIERILTGCGVGGGGGGQLLSSETLKKGHVERIDIFDGFFDYLHLFQVARSNET